MDHPIKMDHHGNEAVLLDNSSLESRRSKWCDRPESQDSGQHSMDHSEEFTDSASVHTECTSIKCDSDTLSNSSVRRSANENDDNESVDSLFGETGVTFLDACLTCDVNAVRDIVKRGAIDGDVNAQDKSGKTGMGHICYMGYLVILELLVDIQEILDVNLADNEGNTPLIFAAQSGHKETTGFLLEHFHNIIIDKQNNSGFTALIKAAVQGRTECAKMLLEADASVTHRDAVRGMCAGEWAQFCGRHECSDLLNKYSGPKKIFKRSFKKVGPVIEQKTQHTNVYDDHSTNRERLKKKHQTNDVDDGTDDVTSCLCFIWPLRRAFSNTTPKSEERKSTNNYSISSVFDVRKILSTNSPVAPDSTGSSPLSSPQRKAKHNLDILTWSDSNSTYSFMSERLTIPALEVTSQSGETVSIETGVTDSNIYMQPLENS